MNNMQINNKEEGNCALKAQYAKPFSMLTLSNMIEKFHIEAKNKSDCKTDKLNEINPFDGSFQIEIINSINDYNQDSEANFLKIKSFAERAKEEGLI